MTQGQSEIVPVYMNWKSGLQSSDRNTYVFLVSLKLVQTRSNSMYVSGAEWEPGKKILSDGWTFFACTEVSHWDISLLEERVKIYHVTFPLLWFYMVAPICFIVWTLYGQSVVQFSSQIMWILLEFPAKILSGILSLEHYDYFYNDSNLSDLCLQRMQKRLIFYFPDHELFLVQQLQNVKKVFVFPLFSVTASWQLSLW